AYGYVNTKSFIIFRRLTSLESEKDFFLINSLKHKLEKALEKRKNLPQFQASFRWIFAEADDLPGLIIDRFLIETAVGKKQVLSLQVNTAGMQAMLKDPLLLLQEVTSKYFNITWEDTAVLLRYGKHSSEFLLGDSNLQVLKLAPFLDLSQSQIVLNSLLQTLKMQVNFIQGQKTGFFLDQADNITLLLNHLHKKVETEIKVLDLFCYVGQWGAAIAHYYKKKGAHSHITLVDASEIALDLAVKNIQEQEGLATSLKMDIQKKIRDIPDNYYDIVICDPPAFIKSAKDKTAGEEAYLKLNRQAIQKVKREGIFVTCSCSHHLSSKQFDSIIKEVLKGRENYHIIEGRQALDHPLLANFPEGQYLKAKIILFY
nr:class I SAM-dependent rRNA methyltransferase [Bacteriovoracaceae bacterium]